MTGPDHPGTDPLATPEALARRLWAAPPDAPAALDGMLADRIQAGLAHDTALDLLRMLHAAGPCVNALDAAARRWPGSVDIALMAAEASNTQGPDARQAAHERLAALVHRTGRRAEARARLLWRSGAAAAARAALSGPAAQLTDAALVARVDLALRAGDWSAAQADLAALDGRIAPGHHLALGFRLLWLREGAAALVCRLGGALGRRADTLPAAPGLWRALFDLFMASQDLPRATRALDRLHAITGPVHPETRAAAMQHALECGNAEAAARLLASLPDADAPWRWSARRHMQFMRTGLLQARSLDQPQARLAALAHHAQVACRLHARHNGLMALGWTCSLGAGAWNALARDLQTPPAATSADQVPGAALMLGRIGLPGAGLDLLQRNSPAPQAPATAIARHALARARLQRETGTSRCPGRQDADLEELAALALPASLVADIRLEQATAATDARRYKTALALLSDPLRRFPRRPALWLARARAAFLLADFAAAARALDRFNALKAARRGDRAEPDLRDMILADALAASHTLPPGALEGPADAVVARIGVDRIAASTALSACLLARVGQTGRFVPQGAGGTVPPRLLHYWEGPESAPATRNLSEWARLHPAMAQHVFGPDEARAWLDRHDPPVAALFAALAQPAARADLFRLAVLARDGGLWVDVDEYPCAPVSDWLAGADGVFVIEPGFGTVANNFIAAAPGLAVIRHARAQAIDAVRARLAAGTLPYPWRDSGPAVMTRALGADVFGPYGGAGLRLLKPANYLARVATNLPLPHKRGALHWR
ncbi:MAG: hypothetical protein JJU19_16725 [Pararhodobacter sp.]|nr:hypothetical protein [Pararhodobacter sp.]